MRVYANGLKLHINEIVRLTFLDGFDNTITTVAEICVNVDTLKMIYESIGTCLAQYDAHVAKLQENALKAN